MAPEVPTVVPLGRAQRSRAADALTRAFADDPMWASLLAGTGASMDALRPMWNAVIGYSLVYGAVHTTPAGVGAACWMAPGKTNTTLWKLLRTGMALPCAMMRLPTATRRRFFGMMRFFEGHHKRLVPNAHGYLWALGVDPEAQGRGIGGSLLRPMLAQADEEGISCYLETQTEHNVAFYVKRGFRVGFHGDDPVCGVPVWLMVRDPQDT